jgi:putative RecB family exonuclease
MHRWYLQKVCGLTQAPSANLIVGTAVHAAIEQDGKHTMLHCSPTPLVRYGLPTLLAIALEAMGQELTGNDPDELLHDQEAAMVRQIEASLVAYVEHVQPRYKPLAVESPFMMSLSDTVDFSGFIDAITRSAGVTTIVDFKTANKPWVIGAEHEKDQASAYLLAKWSDPMPEHRVTFITLPMQPNGTAACDVRSTTRTKEQLLTYKQRVLATAGRIEAAQKSGEWEPNTGPLCGWCGVLGACKSGQQWLRLHAKSPAVPVLSYSEVQQS